MPIKKAGDKSGDDGDDFDVMKEVVLPIIGTVVLIIIGIIKKGGCSAQREWADLPFKVNIILSSKLKKKCTTPDKMTPLKQIQWKTCPIRTKCQKKPAFQAGCDTQVNFGIVRSEPQLEAILKTATLVDLKHDVSRQTGIPYKELYFQSDYELSLGSLLGSALVPDWQTPQSKDEIENIGLGQLDNRMPYINMVSKSEWTCSMIFYCILGCIFFPIAIYVAIQTVVSKCSFGPLRKLCTVFCQCCKAAKKATSKNATLATSLAYNKADENGVIQINGVTSSTSVVPVDQYGRPVSVDQIGRSAPVQDNGELSPNFKKQFLAGFCLFIVTVTVIVMFIYNLLCTGSCKRLW